MNRVEWQQLAERWLVDAKAALDAHRWSSAYYQSGYAVECGLKACILARLEATPELIFDERRFSERCWTHDLEELVKLAGLKTTYDADIAANPALKKTWETVMNWDESSRYTTVLHHEAKRLYNAITDKTDGVMQWVRSHW